MLEQRIATAVVLVAVFLVALFWFSTPWFALALAAVVVAAATEWAALLKLSNRALLFVWLTFVCAALVLAWLYREQTTSWVLVLGCAWWLFALWRLVTHGTSPEPVWARLTAGLAVLVPAWAALVYLHQSELMLLVALFLIVWLADIGAYFTGRAFGRTRLAPRLSPGKTVEGLAGGMAAVAVFATIAGLWAGAGSSCLAAWIGLSVVTALASVVGDLWESKMKRIAGVKDSGSLLPGHGGVLDRIDSVTAAAPVYAAGLHIAGGGMSPCGQGIT